MSVKINPSVRWLEIQYINKGRRIKDLANELGCTTITIKNILDRSNIKRKDERAGRIQEKARANLSKDEIVRLYTKEKLPVSKIAKHFNVAASTILRRLHKANINTKIRLSTRGRKASNRIELDKDKVLKEYRKRGATSYSVGKKFGVSNIVILRILKENKEPLEVYRIKSRQYRGKKNPNWRPELTDEERANSRNSNKQLKWREDVYSRDRFTCQKCGDASGHNLNAHHIRAYSKNKALRWTVSNGITFCSSCHRLYHKTYGLKRCNPETLSAFLIERDAK